MISRLLHKLDRALLYVAEALFGPREGWQWWQRRKEKYR